MSYGNENKLNKNLPVVMNDALIYSRHHTIPTGMKLVFVTASKIKEDDMALKEFTYSVKEFCELLEIKATGKYDKLKMSCENLIQSYVSLETKKGWKVYPWFHHIEYFEKEGKIAVQFHEYLAPYLLYVRDNIYTKLSLHSLLKFKSQYSMRFYMFCRQVLKEWKNTGEKTFTLEELRLLLGVDDEEYKLYADFKRKVLLKAQSEINESSDVHFDFEEEKEARKVVKIRLLIKNSPVDREKTNIDVVQKEVQQKKFKSREDLALELVSLALKKYGTALDIKKILTDGEEEICHMAIMQTLQEMQEGEYDKYGSKMDKPSYIYGILRIKNKQYS